MEQLEKTLEEVKLKTEREKADESLVKNKDDVVNDNEDVNYEDSESEYNSLSSDNELLSGDVDDFQVKKDKNTKSKAPASAQEDFIDEEEMKENESNMSEEDLKVKF